MNYLNKNRRLVELCDGTYGESLSNVRFFPYQYIPETVETSFAFICYDIMASYNPTNSTLTNITLLFWPACHIDKAIIKNATGLRYDLMAEVLMEDFANQDFLGIGKTQIIYDQIYVASPEIRGREIQMSTYDISPEAYNRHAQSIVW